AGGHSRGEERGRVGRPVTSWLDADDARRRAQSAISLLTICLRFTKTGTRLRRNFVLFGRNSWHHIDKKIPFFFGLRARISRTGDGHGTMDVCSRGSSDRPWSRLRERSPGRAGGVGPLSGREDRASGGVNPPVRP